MPKPRKRRAHGYSVYKRKDGRYGWGVTIDYDPETGNPKRIQGICRKEDEAQQNALAALAKYREGKEQPQGRDQTMADFLEQWLDLYVRPHREPKTVKYYEGMIKLHIKPTLGKTPLRKVTSAKFQQLLNDKAKPIETKNEKGEVISSKRLSAETLRGIRATLRSALTRAYKDGLVGENIASRVITPKAPRKDPEYLDQEQVAKLVKTAKGHELETLLIVALLTGLRIGEITGLRWEDIDMEARTLRVQRQLQRIDKKLTLKGLKSASSRRTLYLPPTGMEALKIHRRDQFASLQNPKRPRNDMNLVFLNAEGRPLDPKYVDKRLKQLMEDAKVPPMSFHKLRHTAATLLLAGGVPLSVVKDQLGHSQISLTSNTYGHAVPEALRTAGEALERTLRPNGTGQERNG